MKIITSFDDGHPLDFKIAKLLLKYELPGIFYISNYTLLDIDQIKELSEYGFTIGGHTVTQPESLRFLSPDQQFKEISRNKRWLEEIIGKNIKYFAYPSGRFDETTIIAVKKAWFKYARTTLVGNTECVGNRYKIRTTVHVRPDRKEYANFKSWLDYAKIKFIEAKQRENGCYHVWGHAKEIEEFNLWDQLEELFKYITNK